jgi:hypothetical protein
LQEEVVWGSEDESGVIASDEAGGMDGVGVFGEVEFREGFSVVAGDPGAGGPGEDGFLSVGGVDGDADAVAGVGGELREVAFLPGQAFIRGDSGAFGVGNVKDLG